MSSPPPSSRFSRTAADALRKAIEETGGMEVFAIGDVDHERVVAVTVTCRGQRDAVPALLERPRSGQVVIHNHPSGDLTPSHADMHLAGMYGENGVGVVIVNSAVTRSNWVVEPHIRKVALVDRAALDRFFQHDLPAAIPRAELRPDQVAMAHQVANALDKNEPVVCEAGTGTGKSLAYLVPAALWAMANDRKVVVSTYTKALQNQLATSDLPLLVKGGMAVTYAVMEGRNNYVCKRRMALAAGEDSDLDPTDRVDLDALVAWETASSTGSRSDLPFSVHGPTWERVESDSDLSLSVRCEHYNSCRYYNARRQAAGAHLVVVNHALLLADLSLRAQIDRGVLPNYERLVLDEGHHLQDAATGAASRQVTALGVRRAISPLLDRKRRRGALTRLAKALDTAKIDDAVKNAASQAAARAAPELDAIARSASHLLSDVSGVLSANEPSRRVVHEWEESDEFEVMVRSPLTHLSTALHRSVGLLEDIHTAMGDAHLPDAIAQPIKDVGKAQRRLSGHADVLRVFLDPASDPDTCRWVGLARARGEPSAEISAAPVDVAPTLKAILWEPLPGTTVTSATLSVAHNFGFWRRGSGLAESQEMVLPSPFEWASQVLLGTPRDLPPPHDPRFLNHTARAVTEAVLASGGGAFVLCTSYAAIRTYTAALRAVLPPSIPVLVQRSTGTTELLRRFRESGNAVLVGTDSFWEGVSVPGNALRLVVIPRLPFRVPTDPLRIARHERVQARGGDPFAALSLPEAIMRLRQGFGRLIRSKRDRGVVLILDRRLHTRSYGRRVIRALPPARRVNAPWRRVHEEITAFFNGQR